MLSYKLYRKLNSPISYSPVYLFSREEPKPQISIVQDKEILAEMT